MDGGPQDVDLELPVDASIDIERYALPGAFGLEVAAPNGRFHVDLTLGADGLLSKVVIDRQDFHEEIARVGGL